MRWTTDNQYRTQEQAIAYHQERNERMFAIPDMVQVKDQETLNMMRKACRWHWIVSGTRMVYNRNNLSAKVIQSVGSKNQTEHYLKEVPIYWDTPIAEVLAEDAGLELLRALLQKPKFTKEEIINLLKEFSGKAENKIRLYTPDQSSRASRPIRSVVLCSLDFWFVLVCFDWFDDDAGFSFGVNIDSAPKEQGIIFSNKAKFDLENKTITIPLQRKYIKQINKISRQRKVKINWKLNLQIK